MELVLKTSDSARSRGFESLSLRHNIQQIQENGLTCHFMVVA